MVLHRIRKVYVCVICQINSLIPFSYNKCACYLNIFSLDRFYIVQIAHKHQI